MAQGNLFLEGSFLHPIDQPVERINSCKLSAQEPCVVLSGTKPLLAIFK